jgi:hypothetical protein
VSRNVLDTLKAVEKLCAANGWSRETVIVPQAYEEEARGLTTSSGQSKEELARKIHDAYIAHGIDDFVTKRSAQPGFRLFARKRWNRLPAMLGSLALLWWSLILMFQGEGLELDLQRRRHPMWE